MQLAGGSQRQLGQGTIVFHVEHSGTETVEYGVRATIKIIGLRARSSTWCLKVRLVFQAVRHREVAREEALAPQDGRHPQSIVWSIDWLRQPVFWYV